jgi:ethanolamine utilization protein EutA
VWDHHGDHDDEEDAYYADSIELTTVGIDVGSSTSHLMFSRLHLQRMGQYLSSRYVVTNREMLHRSPILLTPYRADNTIDAAGLDVFFRRAYIDAGLTPDDVDSGAIILTGEAIKRTNARAVADLFAEHAGKFVCASAGHNLEAILAANGSGALRLSRSSGADVVLNVDLGGGTSKLALVSRGHVIETAAINVGGRLVAFDAAGRIARIEPAARSVGESLGLDLQLGRVLPEDDRRSLAEALAACLFEVVQREPLSPLAESLMLTARLSCSLPIRYVTFSGGVSEYLFDANSQDFGDIARPLADAIGSRIAATGAQVQPAVERIRATVIGASQFTVQVSGNTIAISREELLPMHNLLVVYPRVSDAEAARPEVLSAAIGRAFQRFDVSEGDLPVAIALKWAGEPAYASLRGLAEGIVQALPRTLAAGLPVVLVFANDYGKLIGGIIREEFAPSAHVVSIDGIELQEFDYIDIGAMLYPSQVVPVVVKSLVFPEVHGPQAELADD